MSKLLRGLLIGAAVICTAPVQAAFYNWTYQATIQTPDADPLGLNGDQLTMTFGFDSDSVWKAGIANPTYLYLDTASASASILGHTAGVSTSTPAAFQWSPGSTHFSEQYDSTSFVDLIIDDTVYQLYMWLIAQTPAVTNASAGDHLSIDQLPRDADTLFARFFGGASAPVEYSFVDESIQITTIPEPTTMALLGLALGGLAFSRRRVAH